MDVKVATGYGVVIKGEKLSILKDYVMGLYRSGSYDKNIWFTLDENALELFDAVEEIFYDSLEVDGAYDETIGEDIIFLVTKSSYHVSYDFVGSYEIADATAPEEVPAVLTALAELLDEPLRNRVIWLVYR